ncbi:MerR family transcriptional regulator [Myxococcota bacterium]|nr:MerR family transcriptional regulator [Myxococcota bacterium]
MGYRIKTVADLVGISKGTLLAWERRYSFVVPERAENGYREYGEADVERLRRIKRLVDEGYKISEAISLTQDAAAPAPAIAPAEIGGVDLLMAELLDALISYDLSRAVTLNERLAGLSFLQRIELVYMPLLQEVGERWADGRVSVAQEHFASEFCREQLASMLVALGYGPKDGPTAVCATFPTERHELALLSLAVRLALVGYRVRYLGADVPLKDLCGAAQDLVPRVVVVSLTMPQPQPELERYTTLLRACCAPQTRVILGGPGVPDGVVLPRGVTVMRRLDHLSRELSKD